MSRKRAKHKHDFKIDLSNISEIDTSKIEKLTPEKIKKIGESNLENIQCLTLEELPPFVIDEEIKRDTQRLISAIKRTTNHDI